VPFPAGLQVKAGDTPGSLRVRTPSSAIERARVAVLIPCFNEAEAIGSVVAAFSHALPSAKVYVYDNNSSDGSPDIAKSAGAVVRQEPRQGKGHVIRRMFADVEADAYILVDGDGTYEASVAPALLDLLLQQRLDLVNGARVSVDRKAFRPGHRFGNHLLSALVRLIFGRQFADMLSGYKVLSRRFVKSFPATATGFETETEIAVHALELRMPCAEVGTRYEERAEGSVSKLRTYRDGLRILLLIARLVKDERPLQFFGLLGIALTAAAIVLGVPIFVTFMETGLVPRLPTATLAASLVIVGVVSFAAGLVLEMTTRTRQELKRLFYLSIPAFSPGDDG